MPSAYHRRMPPQPLFQSARNQTIAVAGLMAVFLLCATGLAKLQAGDGSRFLNTRKLPEPTSSSGQNLSLLIDTPAHWQTIEDKNGHFVAADPDKPTRRITLTSMSADEKASPVHAAEQFLDKQLDTTARQTYHSLSEPITVTNHASGLRGVQFIGASHDEQGVVHLHLLACLTLGGKYYWWVYLTDPLPPGETHSQALQTDLRLLKNVYRSARIVKQ